MSEFDSKYNIVEESTPPNVPLSAHYKNSFAYYTIRERLPVILTLIVDHLSRDKEVIASEYASESENAKEDIKEVQGQISKLKYELQTDKKLTPIPGTDTDQDVWNNFLQSLDEEKKSYFTATWLYAECYMYRRLKSFFNETKYLKHFDCFRKQKQTALLQSFNTIKVITDHYLAILNARDDQSNEQVETLFKQFLKLCLWGNRCDLSISQGKQIKQTENPLTSLESLEQYILADQTADIWQCIAAVRNQNKTIDFVQDNSGYELFTDLILASFLIEFNLAGKIRFHIKAVPWFISDVMHHDFHWTINQLITHEHPSVAAFGERITGYMRDGKFELCLIEHFWTAPYEFAKMSTVNKALYDNLATAHLLIFKGDLNYRKLLGDFNWPFDAKFEHVLQGFKPTNLCTLRTVKADLLCEVPISVCDELTKQDAMWMETGQYAVIHFATANGN